MPMDATNYNNNTAEDAREKSRLIFLCAGEVKPIAANQAVKAKLLHDSQYTAQCSNSSSCYAQPPCLNHSKRFSSLYQ